MTRFIASVFAIIGIGAIAFGAWCIICHDKTTFQVLDSVAMSFSGLSLIGSAIALWMVQQNSELLDKMEKDLE